MRNARLWRHFTRISIVVGFVAAIVGIVAPFISTPDNPSTTVPQTAAVAPAEPAAASPEEQFESEETNEEEDHEIPGLRAYIALGHPNRTDNPLIPFLKSNAQALVYLDITIDLSAVLTEEGGFEVWNRCNPELLKAPGNPLFNRRIGIPVAFDDRMFDEIESFYWFSVGDEKYDCFDFIEFKTQRSDPEQSFFGTGMSSSRFTGFYYVDYVGAGASTVYALEEQEADLAMRAEYQKKYENFEGE